MDRKALIAMLLVALVASAGRAQAGDPGSGEIVGGGRADPDEYPFVVALVRSTESPYDGQRCGGTLIHPSWVLTAGHCVVGRSTSYFDVYANDFDLKGDGDRIPIDEILVHPDFDGTTLENDVALVRLETPANPGAGPTDTVRLPLEADRRHFAAGEMVTIVGWGDTEGQPPGVPEYPRRLREVEVPVTSNEQCAATYAGFTYPEMLCAGYDLGGKDSCQGDSGGPLLVRRGDGTFLQAGIVSWGIGCADAGYYGVYTRTATYACWIAETMANGTLGHGRTVVMGTPGRDVITGTEGSDVLVGLAGDDVLKGRGGGDALCGGSGDDLLVGGPRKDLLDGGGGVDTLRGSAGHDVLLGGAGSDVLIGSSGADVLVGGRDADEAYGKRGQDLIAGSPGGDLLVGGRQADRLFGGRGSDTLRGNRGDDLLVGNGGFDQVDGGGGVDECVGESTVLCEV